MLTAIKHRFFRNPQTLNYSNKSVKITVFQNLGYHISHKTNRCGDCCYMATFEGGRKLAISVSNRQPGERAKTHFFGMAKSTRLNRLPGLVLRFTADFRLVVISQYIQFSKNGSSRGFQGPKNAFHVYMGAETLTDSQRPFFFLFHPDGHPFYVGILT